jgi:HEPN domain-containing protein
LINDVPVPVDPNYSLRIEAKKAFHEGNYFLSVVLSGTAVEALVKYYLIVKPEVISKSEITKIAQVYSF